MAGFMAALVLVALTGFGGRDQLLLARMAEERGAAGALLGVGWASVLAATLLMAVAGQAIGALMPPAARTMLVAIALVFAAFDLAWPVKRPAFKEPTRSLGALFVVLLSRQISDSPRFIVFSLAIWSANAWLAVLGGAMAGLAGLTLGWLLGEELERGLPLRAIRLALAAVLGVAGIVIGLSARGLIG